MTISFAPAATTSTSTVRAASTGAASTRTRPAGGAQRRERHGTRRAGAARSMPRRQAVLLLADAEAGLGAAIRAGEPGERYAAAHLAALRGTAALLASRPPSGRGRLGNAWDLLAKVSPEGARWASYFRAGVAKRQLAEAGNTRVVGRPDADEMVRRTGQFLELVRTHIGRVG